MWISIDGGTLAYADAGQGTPLLLLHGFPLDRTIWDAVAAELSREARVLRPDLRGLGASSVTGGPYLMEALAADLAALLDALDIERVAIAGHSLGGYVALAFFRMFRERVSALALIASRIEADSEPAAADREALAQRAEREGMEPVEAAFLPRMFAAATRSLPAIEDVRRIIARTDPHGAASMLRGMALRVDAADLLEDLDVPFLMFTGENDHMLDRAAAERAVARAARGRLEIVPGASHMPMLEAPAATVAALRRLLAEAR